MPVGPVVLGADIDAWAPDVNDAGIVVGTNYYQAYHRLKPASRVTLC